MIETINQNVELNKLRSAFNEDLLVFERKNKQFHLL